MNLLGALFLILFEAVPEALYDTGHKTLSGFLEFAYLAVITVTLFAVINKSAVTKQLFNVHSFYNWNAFLFKYWKILAGYVLVRFGLFDFTYNITAGLNLFYIGDTKIYDKILGWFFEWSRISPEHMLVMFKFIALAIGVTWLARKEK